MRRRGPARCEYDVAAVGRRGRPHGARARLSRRWSGTPEPGDRVLLNVSALERGLGTGRLRLVVALPGPAAGRPARGAGARGQGPLHAAAVDGPRRRRAGEPAPRRCCATPTTSPGCRSSSPTCTPPCRRCWPGCATGAPRRRVAYVMTDGGALPLASPARSPALRDAGLARRDASRSGRRSAATSRRSTCTPACSPRATSCGADVAVVAQGPGNLGTGTRWGFSGTSAGEAVNAAATLGGRPVAVAAGLRGRRRASGTAACRTTASRRTGGSRWHRRTCRCRCCPGRSARGSAQQARGPGRRQRRPAAAARGGGRRPDEALRAQPGPALDDGPRAGPGPGRRSSPRRPPAGTRPRCSDPVRVP